jgi:hypothetical protein
LLLPFKRRLSRREWNLIIIYVIILISSLSFTLVGNFISEVKSLREEIETKELKLARLRRFITYRKDIEQKYKDLPFVEIKTDFNRFTQAVEKLATTAGISIVNIRPLSTKEEAWYKEHSLFLEGESDTILEVARFLYFAKDSNIPLKVNHIGISASREGLLKVSLELKTASFLSKGQ